MTKNQIEYWRNQETERHNRALEAQGLMGLEVQREANRIQASSASEVARANRARESNDMARTQNEFLRTAETNRSNLAQEEIARNTLAETKRHNEQMEYIQANNNPWTTFATTIGSLFGNEDTGGASTIGNGLTSVVDDAWNRGVKPAVSNVVGIADSFRSTVLGQGTSGGVLSNGVKQLPNLSSYTSSANRSSKTQPTKTTTVKTVHGNNPIVRVGRTQTLKGAKSR